MNFYVQSLFADVLTGQYKHCSVSLVGNEYGFMSFCSLVKTKTTLYINLRIIYAVTPMKTVVSLSGHNCNECLFSDSFISKSTLYMRICKMRGKPSNSVVVLRVVALKCAELVAVVKDAPVENKP